MQAQPFNIDDRYCCTSRIPERLFILIPIVCTEFPQLGKPSRHLLQLFLLFPVEEIHRRFPGLGKAAVLRICRFSRDRKSNNCGSGSLFGRNSQQFTGFQPKHATIAKFLVATPNNYNFSSNFFGDFLDLGHFFTIRKPFFLKPITMHLGYITSYLSIQSACQGIFVFTFHFSLNLRKCNLVNVTNQPISVMPKLPK